MCKFIKLIINKKRSIFKNIQYLPDVISLFKKYDKYLNDDYANEENIDGIVKLIEKTNGYFWLIIDKENSEFAGFVFLENWVGKKDSAHSAEVTTCFCSKFWGDFTKKCAKKFVKYCFKKYKLKKLKAIIYPENFRVSSILTVSGFKKEALLKGETIRNGKLQDIEIYSFIKE